MLPAKRAGARLGYPIALLAARGANKKGQSGKVTEMQKNKPISSQNITSWKKIGHFSDVDIQ
jgi:hypothetical protein